MALTHSAHTPSAALSRPRVLLVDDHLQILDNVSAILSEAFDVAGLATDGMHAVDTARQVRPDVIVLDVEMPGLDGFQTLRALEQGGLGNTPIVFLSMHQSAPIISEAFRSGARGYVLKTRVGRDLSTALDEALHGRIFVPSLSSLLHVTRGGGHAMHVHDDLESSVDDVVAFFDLALQRGDATCLIGTSRFRESVAEGLRARGWDVGGESGHKRYLAVDTADALGRFVRNGLPDRDGIVDVIKELEQYRREVCERETSLLAIFGNTAGSLSASGNTRASIELERDWNSLTADLPFLTVCGYCSACFHDGVPNMWGDACAEHGALTHAKDV